MTDKIFSVASLAVLFSSISLLPQVLAVYKAGSIEGISPTFLAFDGIGAILWIIYGRRIGDRATIISSSISLVLIAAMGAAFYVFQNKDKLLRRQQEDDRFQYGGPMMSRNEPILSMPSSHHFGGAQDSYRGSPEDDEQHVMSQDYGLDENYGGGLFGGSLVTSGMEMSDNN